MTKKKVMKICKKCFIEFKEVIAEVKNNARGIYKRPDGYLSIKGEEERYFIFKEDDLKRKLEAL